MTFLENNRFPDFLALEELEEFSAKAGLEEAEMDALLRSGLDFSHIMEYLEARLAQRMN